MATMMDAPVRVTSTSTGVSRLAQMQARFQQKQMQEKEQKLLRLYESQTQRAFQRVGRGSAGSSSSSVSSTSSSLGAGKVRQLFQDRRPTQNRSYSNGNKSGWDRSYPLEPLENNTATTKQRLQASKSTGNLKVARGTSLERSYSNSVSSNQYQKNQARRSKSQVRSNHHPPNVVVDLGGSFRQLSHSQQKLYYDDDDDDVDYPGNHHYQDEQNNRISSERDYREAGLFKHRVYDDDIENEDPPFQQLDDDDDDDDVVNHFEASHSYQKLPNVGGRLQMENKANNNNNVDRYKTYNATTNGVRNNRRSLGDKEENRRVAPAKEPLRRREQEVATAGARPSALRSSPSARKPESKVSTLTTTTTKGSISRNTTPPKTESTFKRTSVEPHSWEKENTYRKTPSEDTEHQMIQRGAPPKGPSARGAPVAPQSAPTRPTREQPLPRAPPPQARAPPPARTAKGGPQSKAFTPPSNVDLAACKICGRQFAKDRIPVHENICSKTTQKKRKTFDPLKQRVKGTEAEAFLRKGKPQPVTHLKKTNWRQKHEDFIRSIRAAKEMKAHVAKGGKLSDLPPPPPSDYSDYVECPHCGRRFNQQAAERHIPKCANYEFNKPKPGAGRGGRGAVPKKR